MFHRIKNSFHKEIIRPLIYKVFTRGILALFAAQLIHFFAPAGSSLTDFSNLSLFLGFLFVLFAVLSWLRMDGLKIPQLKLPRLKRNDPPFLSGNMADHLDDEIVSFDDLDENEQNLCIFLADLILVLICLVFSLILSR